MFTNLCLRLMQPPPQVSGSLLKSPDQSQKNHVSVSAMLTRKFLLMQKVFVGVFGIFKSYFGQCRKIQMIRVVPR